MKERFFKAAPFLFVFILSLTLLLIPIGSADEMWNYNYARCISRGMAPYTDFNIVQTPLSAYFPALLLRLFGGGLFTFRVAAVILSTVLYSALYVLGKDLSGKSGVSVCVVFVIFVLHYTFLIYNYNYVNAAVILIAILLDRSLEKRGRTVRGEILLGLLFGVTPLIKQTTGALLLFAEAAICLLDVFLFKRDKCLAAVRFAASAIPGILFVLVLLLRGHFSAFWEYAVAGIGTFTHRFTFFDLLTDSPAALIIAAIPVGICVYAAIKLFRGGFDRSQTFLGIISLAQCAVAYPLCDVSHYLCIYFAAVPFLMSLIGKREKKRKTDLTVSVVIAELVAFVIIAFPPRAEYAFSHLNNFRGLIINTELEEYVGTVSDYIAKKRDEGVSVYIVDDDAVVFTIPLDMYRKHWDMLLVGNLGSTTVEELLDTEPDSVFLIRDRAQLDYQAHFELADHITENYVPTGEEVGRYAVYVKP